MDVFHQTLLVLAGILLVLLNGFFVASEFSIVKVRPTRLQELKERGVRGAATASGIVHQMDEYLSATQLGITVASLGLGWIGEPAFAGLIEPLFARFGEMQTVLAHSLAVTIAFLIITFLHIVIGELAPKSVAIQQAERMALWTAAPLAVFYRVSYPFIWALNGAAGLFLRLVGFAPVVEGGHAHSPEELRLILTQSQEKGVLDRDERLMLERVFEFGNRTVRQIMVPSTEVVFFDIRKTVEENLETARRHQHTRYPLCDGNLDRVLGIVHVKDLFWKHRELGPRFDFTMMKRPVEFIPDSAPVRSLLAELRRTRTHLAMVVDEYGSTVGVVTLDNVISELVGDIRDEFDIGPEAAYADMRKMDDKRYLVRGRVLLEELDNELGITIDDEENDTIGGHVMMLLGRAAVIGDEVRVSSAYRVRVVGMKGLQITDLIIEQLDSPGTAAS
ncbi:MAG: HlyC/CorC family transporter [Acidobacteria bacterium]|nr:MAG: HlyC/CorC family transporter [Acidobacteriota bacterium]